MEIEGTHVRATGAGAPLVLIHGVGLDLEIWEPLVPRLQPGRRLIRYDMRGHGASAKPPGSKAFPQLPASKPHCGLSPRNRWARSSMLPR